MQTLYLSRLQHYLFCPRQFALIELECAWEENIFTAEGQVMHEKVNSGGHDTRGNIKTVRTLRLGHAALGLEGVADVVEYHTDTDGQQTPFPIEYKGALFYGKTRRRHSVVFDEELRQITLDAINDCRHIIESGQTPKPTYSTSKCRNCSLKDICHPKIFNKNAKAWLSKKIATRLEETDH